MASRIQAAIAITALGLAMGCQDGEDRYEVYPVTGKVLHNGQAVEDARVTFYADEVQDPKRPIPTAETEADGAYQLTSYQPGDGAPPGNYHVTVTWPAPIPPGAHPEAYSPSDRLQGKYSNPETSGLTATVTEDENVVAAFYLK
jgi:hypothetical protein